MAALSGRHSPWAIEPHAEFSCQRWPHRCSVTAADHLYVAFIRYRDQFSIVIHDTRARWALRAASRSICRHGGAARPWTSSPTENTRTKCDSAACCLPNKVCSASDAAYLVKRCVPAQTRGQRCMRLRPWPAPGRAGQGGMQTDAYNGSTLLAAACQDELYWGAALGCARPAGVGTRQGSARGKLHECSIRAGGHACA